MDASNGAKKKSKDESVMIEPGTSLMIADGHGGTSTSTPPASAITTTTSNTNTSIVNPATSTSTSISTSVKPTAPVPAPVSIHDEIDEWCLSKEELKRRQRVKERQEADALLMRMNAEYYERREREKKEEMERERMERERRDSKMTETVVRPSAAVIKMAKDKEKVDEPVERTLSRKTTKPPTPSPSKTAPAIITSASKVTSRTFASSSSSTTSHPVKAEHDDEEEIELMPPVPKKAASAPSVPTSSKSAVVSVKQEDQKPALPHKQRTRTRSLAAFSSLASKDKDIPTGPARKPGPSSRMAPLEDLHADRKRRKGEPKPPKPPRQLSAREKEKVAKDTEKRRLKESEKMSLKEYIEYTDWPNANGAGGGGGGPIGGTPPSRRTDYFERFTIFFLMEPKPGGGFDARDRLRLDWVSRFNLHFYFIF